MTAERWWVRAEVCSSPVAYPPRPAWDFDVVVMSDVSDDGGIASAVVGHWREGFRDARASLSIVPAIRPVGFRGCHWIVVHDCRHVSEPWAYSRIQRAYRDAVFGLAERYASHVITVSEATRRALSARWPRLADRAKTIPAGVRAPEEDASGHLSRAGQKTLAGIAFGHLPNKRPETAARAWLRVGSGEKRLGTLYIVGIPTEAERHRLQQLRSHWEIGTGDAFPSTPGVPSNPRQS